MPTELQTAIDHLSRAQRVVVFTGAGVSAESGIPTFRDDLTGLWARFDPQRLATPEAFVDDPELVWGWYEWRRAWQEVQECDLLLSVGTSGAVYPAAQLPQLALEQGAVVVHVNPDPVTVSSERELSLVGRAGEVLPRLVEKL